MIVGSISLSSRQIQVAVVIVALPFVAVLVRAARPAVLLSLGLVAEVFSGHWLTMGIRIPVDRALLIAGVVSALWRPEVRHKLRQNARPIHLLLLALSLYGLASAFRHGTLSGGEGFWGLFDRLGLLPFAFFVLAPIVFATEADRNVFLGVLVGLGGYLSVTAVFEIVGPKQLVFPRYIADPSIVTHLGRARGPFVEAVANGMALYCCGVVAIVGLVLWRTRIARELAFAVALLSVIGVVFSLTRSVWLGSTLATVVAILAVPRARRWMAPCIAGAAVVVGLCFLLVPGFSAHASQRAGEQGPLIDRYNLNSAAIRMIKAKPLLGFGWDRFGADSLEYLQQADAYPLTGKSLDVHNVPLLFAAELGLAGATMWTVALLGAVGLGIAHAWRNDVPVVAAAVIAIALSWAGTALFSPLAQAFPNLLLWAWAGYAMSLPKRHRIEQPRSVIVDVTAITSGTGLASGEVTV